MFDVDGLLHVLQAIKEGRPVEYRPLEDPERGRSGYTGEIDVRINPAKKDGTRSNREFVLWSMEIDRIKKID